MNLKLVKKSDQTFDSGEIQAICDSLKLPHTFVELLYSRGIVGKEAIDKFLSPDITHFHDPFLMKGMREAVNRLQIAIDNGEKVVVYGDYDVDGVCSAAILSLYLAGRGLEVYTHIPSRISDGYGLNTESIERIIEDCMPDLILTCDCGISGYKEVEECDSLGVDVIVTDHHEVAEIIPSCIVVDPHQTDCDYPFEYLCGAGIALKLVQALGGEEALKTYLELAAVATIADLVPLVDENRLIVQLGLKTVDGVKNIGLKRLIKSQKPEGILSSSDIAFRIAPRINAAGRMGDAYSAFELLTTDDIEKIDKIIADIDENNLKRKELCARLYDEAISDLKNENVIDRRCIILSHPDWEKGITGIVAARLAGEFMRPAFILVKSGNSYKGTVRSIAEINVHTLLGEMSDLLIEYGGHSQAAGFSIEEENIPLFKTRVAEYLKKFPRELFEPELKYDLELTEADLTQEFAHCLDLLEPTGNGNPKPLFKLTSEKLRLQPCKSNFQHTQITLPNEFQIFAFNNYSCNHFLTTEGVKSFVIELQTNFFNGREYLRGVLRGVSIDKLTFSDEVAGANYIKAAALSSDAEPKFTYYGSEELNGLVGDNIYGTLIICGCNDSYRKFVDSYEGDNVILHEFMYASIKNNFSRIIVSPEFDDRLWLNGYEKIIFLDKPINPRVISYLNEGCDAKIFVPRLSQKSIMDDVSLDRSDFAYYYDILKRYRSIKAPTLWSFYKTLACHAKVGLRQFMTCLMVFIDLGFISITSEEFGLRFHSDVRADLNSSPLYRRFSEYKNR